MGTTRNQRMANQCKDRDGLACVRCKQDDDLHAHHILSVAEGGSDDLDNLVTLCADCHSGWHHACEGWVSFDAYLASSLKARSGTSHSKRTREGLQKTKAAGTKLGTPKRVDQEYNEELLARVVALEAAGVTALKTIARELNLQGFQTPLGKIWYDTSLRNRLETIRGRPHRPTMDDFMEMVFPTIRELIQQGITSDTKIAKELNRIGQTAPLGGRWHGTTVSNLRNRFEKWLTNRNG